MKEEKFKKIIKSLKNKAIMYQGKHRILDGTCVEAEDKYFAGCVLGKKISISKKDVSLTNFQFFEVEAEIPDQIEKILQIFPCQNAQLVKSFISTEIFDKEIKESEFASDIMYFFKKYSCKSL